MSRATRTLDGASIVLHGAFDPRRFHPAWFVAQGLLAADEAKAAIPGDGGAVLVVSGELTAWHAGWIAVQVTRERLAATCDDVAHAEALARVVDGLLPAVEEPRLTAIELQRTVHVRLSGERDRRDFGRSLAPATPWATVMSEPELQELRVAGGKLGAPEVAFAMAIRPSSRATPHGLVVQTSERHPTADVARALDVLARGWTGALRDADVAVQRLFDAFYDVGA